MKFRFWCFLWVIIISLGTYHPKWRMLKYAWLGYGHHYAVMKYIRNSSVESDMWASGYGFHFPSFWFLSSLCRVQLDARVSNEKFLNNPRLTSMSGPGNALQHSWDWLHCNLCHSDTVESWSLVSSAGVKCLWIMIQTFAFVRRAAKKIHFSQDLVM